MRVAKAGTAIPEHSANSANAAHPGPAVAATGPAAHSCAAGPERVARARFRFSARAHGRKRTADLTPSRSTRRGKRPGRRGPAPDHRVSAAPAAPAADRTGIFFFFLAGGSPRHPCPVRLPVPAPCPAGRGAPARRAQGEPRRWGRPVPCGPPWPSLAARAPFGAGAERACPSLRPWTTSHAPLTHHHEVGARGRCAAATNRPPLRPSGAPPLGPCDRTAHYAACTWRAFPPGHSPPQSFSLHSRLSRANGVRVVRERCLGYGRDTLTMPKPQPPS
jgi:hypothetical protein